MTARSVGQIVDDFVEAVRRLKWFLAGAGIVGGWLIVVPIMGPAQATRHILADEARIAHLESTQTQDRNRVTALAMAQMNDRAWARDTLLPMVRMLITMQCIKSTPHEQDLFRGLHVLDCADYSRRRP